jgi:hypothetical protein
LRTIHALYQPLHAVVRSLALTPDGLRYYAHAVIKAEVFQMSRRADPERYLHLLCFIAEQQRGYNSAKTESARGHPLSKQNVKPFPFPSQQTGFRLLTVNLRP